MTDTPTPDALAADLVDMLDVEEIDTDLYRGRRSRGGVGGFRELKVLSGAEHVGGPAESDPKSHPVLHGASVEIEKTRESQNGGVCAGDYAEILKRRPLVEKEVRLQTMGQQEVDELNYEARARSSVKIARFQVVRHFT